jgi:hypothetical protein
MAGPSPAMNDMRKSLGRQVSLLRQAGAAQAHREEFEHFRRDRAAKHRAIASDRQLRVNCQDPTEFRPRLVEPTEMGVGSCLDAHRRNETRLVVQGAISPFDRFIKASCVEVRYRGARAVSDQVA